MNRHWFDGSLNFMADEIDAGTPRKPKECLNHGRG